MKKTTLKISGMHCASCSTIIEKSLSKIDGIKSTSVNLTTNSAHISFDENAIAINDISQKIDSLGYKVVQELDKNPAKKYLYKFIFAGFLSIPIGLTMFINIREIFVNIIVHIDAILLILGTLIVFIAGWDFHVGFIKKLKKGQSNMDTLISIGTLVARGYSIFAFSQTYFVGNEMHFYHFLEGASFIITFISLGKFLELRSKGNASQAIQKLMQLQTKEAIIIKDGKEIKVSIDDVKKGDIVVAKAGDKIAVDGLIIKGQSSIDESMLTGESMPVSKEEGDDVFTGTIVQNGNLHIEVTKEQKETMLARIIQMVDEAQSNKPPIQHLADKISSIFVPSILIISVVAFLIWFYLTGDVQKSLLIMVATIVVACPCAMGLATPMATMVATGTGASRGILIKSGESLEKSKNIDIVVFDKTGTLTEGKPSITDVVSLDNGKYVDYVIQIAYHLAKQSHHPLSRAIVEHIKHTSTSQDSQLQKLQKFKEIAGKGLYGEIGEQTILFGNKKLLLANDIKMNSTITKQIEELQMQGKTVNYVAENNELIGLIAFLDQAKNGTIKGIQALHSMGIETIMISGDTKKTVDAIAQSIGIDHQYGEVHPEEKAEIIKKLQAQNKKVAFVGDGINDAPALAQSDLGISIGQGTDVAIETSEIVLVHGDPYKVVEAIILARKTYKIIRQNLFWAFAYNSVLVPVAAVGLLLPIFASLAMSMSSVSVVLNSLRLKKI